MKKLLLFLFLIISITVNATNYYVKSSGNDSNSGLSEAQAWQTITKVNDFWTAGSFAPGDFIYFNKGDTFYGTITVAESGSAGSPITLKSFGVGANPIITGFTTVTGWSGPSSNVYSKVVTTQSMPNILLVDGVNTPYGRTPNFAPTGWYSNHPYVDSYTSTSMTDADLPDSPSLIGAELAIRTTEWTIERRTITGHNAGTNTISWASDLSYDFNDPGMGYFIQNHSSTLNASKEWYYSGGTLYIYGNPSAWSVKLASLDYLVVLGNYQYITIDGLILEGSNAACVYGNGCDYIVAQNSTIRYNGGAGFRLKGNPTYCTITTSTIDNNNDIGIYFEAYEGGNHNTITYNVITNTGMLNGHGNATGEINNAYKGVLCDGDYGTISYNRITDVGYAGVGYGGTNTVVSYNYIARCLLNKYDGGAIYGYRDYKLGKVLDHNVIEDIQRMKYGWTYDDVYTVEGIYSDGLTDVAITNNTISNVEGKAIFVNATRDNTVQYNTVYDASIGIYISSVDEQLGPEHNNEWALARDHIIRYNKVISYTNNLDRFPSTGTSGVDDKHDDWDAQDEKFLLYFIAIDPLEEDEFANFGTINYNKYAALNKTNDYMLRWYMAYDWTDPAYRLVNLAEIKAYGHEANGTVATYADYPDHNFVCNSTLATKSYTLSQAMTDIDGTSYSGTIQIDAMESLVLFGAGTVSEVSESPDPPTVSTAIASNIRSIYAYSGGNVTDDGGATVTSKGVCWSTSPNPTTASSKTDMGGGEGSFTSAITGLTTNTLYYYRAYATNSEGTSYGTEYSFTTTNSSVVMFNGSVVMDGNSIIVQ